VLGVALGVAVFVGIKTAASSALTSFRDTVTSLAGNAQLQVTGQGNGFPEDLYATVTSSDGVRAATPVLEFNVMAALPVDEPLLMLGIDVFSDREFRQYSFVESKQKTDAILHFSPNLAPLPSQKNLPSVTGSRWVTRWKFFPVPGN
jgi:ABC-type lipoprotein release transport system permease subunit